MTEQQSSSRPLRYNVFLLGKTGSGKSAAGNTILGEKCFISKKSPRSVTQEIQMRKVTFDGVTLNVYDTPGLFDPETSNDITIRKWESQLDNLQLDETARTVFLVVVKADRFTPEERQAVDLIEQVIPEWLIQSTWILFTRGDELEREDLTIEEFIEDTEGLMEVTQRFQNKYHIFNNISENPQQVRDLINKIKESPVIISPDMGFPRTTPLDHEGDPLDRRIVLLGKTGVGKSATGNTILGEKIFSSVLSPSSVTSKSEIQHGVVSGRNVSVIDTPGLFDTKQSPEELVVELGRSIYLSSPGPHSFLYIQPINTRFTKHEENVIEKLEKIFGQEMKKYTIILFTHGDQLEEKSVEMMIQENSSLKRLVDQCGGRYHIFNNKNLRNKKQVSELLQKIDQMVEENGATCYSNEMYQEAARSRREEEERKRREETERITREEEEERKRREETERITREEKGCGKKTEGLQIEKRDGESEGTGDKCNGFKKFWKDYKWFIIAACIGVVVGAIVGAVAGAKVGAGVGAVAVVGAGVGAGIKYALCK